jgi:hypothetical protein
MHPNLLATIFGLTSFTITTGCITLFTALFSLFLSIAESREGKPRFLGIKTKSLKNASIYVSFLTGLLTLFLGWNHEAKTAAEEKEKNRISDSIQTARFLSTLAQVNQTLKKQDTTLTKQNTTLQFQDANLKATYKILTAQHAQLTNQSRLMLDQKIAFDTTTRILKEQLRIRDSLATIIAQGKSTQDTIGQARNDITSINLPLSRGFSATVKFRIYLKGLSDVFSKDLTNTYTLLHPNEVIDSGTKKYFGNMRFENRHKYWNFFFFSAIDWLDRSVQITFEPESPANVIQYAFITAIAAPGGFTSSAEIKYNPVDGYMEWTSDVFSFDVIKNPSNVKNFRQILHNSKIHILVRCPIARQYDLPISNTESKTVQIDHFEIAGVVNFRYGSTGQFNISNLPFTTIPSAGIQPFAQKYFDKEVAPDDAWQYGGIEITLP